MSAAADAPAAPLGAVAGDEVVSIPDAEPTASPARQVPTPRARSQSLASSQHSSQRSIRGVLQRRVSLSSFRRAIDVVTSVDDPAITPPRSPGGCRRGLGVLLRIQRARLPHLVFLDTLARERTRQRSPSFADSDGTAPIETRSRASSLARSIPGNPRYLTLLRECVDGTDGMARSSSIVRLEDELSLASGAASPTRRETPSATTASAGADDPTRVRSDDTFASRCVSSTSGTRPRSRSVEFCLPDQQRPRATAACTEPPTDCEDSGVGSVCGTTTGEEDPFAPPARRESAVSLMLDHSGQHRERLRSLECVVEARAAEGGGDDEQGADARRRESAVEVMMRESPQRDRLNSLGRVVEAGGGGESGSKTGAAAAAVDNVNPPQKRQGELVQEACAARDGGNEDPAPPRRRRESAVEVMMRESPQRGRLDSLGRVVEAGSENTTQEAERTNPEVQEVSRTPACQGNPQPQRRASAVEIMMRESPQRGRLNSLGRVVEAGAADDGVGPEGTRGRAHTNGDGCGAVGVQGEEQRREVVDGSPPPPGRRASAIEIMMRESPQRTRLGSLGRVVEAGDDRGEAPSPAADAASQPPVQERRASAVEIMMRESPQRGRLRGLGRVVEAGGDEARAGADTAPDRHPAPVPRRESAVEFMMRESPERRRLRGLKRVVDANSSSSAPDGGSSRRRESAVDIVMRESPQRERLRSLGLLARAQDEHGHRNHPPRRSSAVEVVLRESPQRGRLDSLALLTKAQHTELEPTTDARRPSPVEIMLRESPQRDPLASRGRVVEARDAADPHRRQSAVEVLVAHSGQPQRLGSLACVLEAQDAGDAPLEVFVDVEAALAMVVCAGATAAATAEATLAEAAHHAARTLQCFWRHDRWARWRMEEILQQAHAVYALAGAYAVRALKVTRVVRTKTKRAAVAGTIVALLLCGGFGRFHLAFKAGHVAVVARVREGRDRKQKNATAAAATTSAAGSPGQRRSHQRASASPARGRARPNSAVPMRSRQKVDAGRGRTPTPQSSSAHGRTLPAYKDFALCVQQVVADERYNTRRSFFPVDLGEILCPAFDDTPTGRGGGAGGRRPQGQRRSTRLGIR